MASNIQVRDKRFIINSWAQDLLKLSGLDHRSFIPKVVLNDHIAFGKFENKITEFYFSSNQGSCSSQVKKYFWFWHNFDQFFFDFWKVELIVRWCIFYAVPKLMICWFLVAHLITRIIIRNVNWIMVQLFIRQKIAQKHWKYFESIGKGPK